MTRLHTVLTPSYQRTVTLTGTSDGRRPSQKADFIYAKLSEKVIGQESAKRNLATLLAMHLAWFARADMDHTAPNALLIGPTGVGKTHAIRTAAQALEVPLIVVDGTRLSPQGYQGTSLEDLLIELIGVARKIISDPNRKIRAEDFGLSELDELEVARRGIIFIDEFDKINSKKSSTAERNELLQRRLLQFIDGTSVILNPHAESGEEEVIFDTAGILFVMSGAFTNLLSDTSKRPQARIREISRQNYVIFEDLVNFGFMKELIARLPVLIEFDKLSKDDLATIMRTEAVNPALFYSRYLSSLGIRLQIDDSAIGYIADKAERLELGARGLHQVLFPILSLLGQTLERASVHDYVLDKEGVQNLIAQIEAGRHVAQ